MNFIATIHGIYDDTKSQFAVSTATHPPGQIKSCSSSEVISMIEGVIHHATNAEVKKNYVDSNGQSLVAFAFSYLLNFELLPRLKRIGAEKLLMPKANFENINNIESLISRIPNTGFVYICNYTQFEEKEKNFSVSMK